MKSIDKHVRETIASRFTEMDTAASKLEDARTAFNDAVREPLALLQAAEEAFKEAAVDYNEALDEAIGNVDDYTEARSDRWHEGEKAREYTAWKEALEGAKVEPEGDEVTDPMFEDVSVYRPEEPPPMKLEDVGA